MSDMVDDLTNQILVDVLSGRPYGLFGHSFGAFLAYEVAANLMQLGVSPPTWLYVSGATPPMHFKNRSRHLMSDNEFRDYVENDCAFDTSVLENADAYHYFSGLLRHDLQTLETHHSSLQQIDIPVEVIVSQDDPNVSHSHIHDWQQLTTASCVINRIPARGHFYLESHKQEIFSIFEKNINSLPVSA
jgi:surfactin synthase thioesterase subunit